MNEPEVWCGAGWEKDLVKRVAKRRGHEGICRAACCFPLLGAGGAREARGKVLPYLLRTLGWLTEEQKLESHIGSELSWSRRSLTVSQWGRLNHRVHTE